MAGRATVFRDVCGAGGGGEGADGGGAENGADAVAVRALLNELGERDQEMAQRVKRVIVQPRDDNERLRRRAGTGESGGAVDSLGPAVEWIDTGSQRLGVEIADDAARQYYPVGGEERSCVCDPPRLRNAKHRGYETNS